MSRPTIINAHDSVEELDKKLQKYFDGNHSLREFEFVFFVIMDGIWSYSEKLKKRIRIRKKEKEELHKIGTTLIVDLCKLRMKYHTGRIEKKDGDKFITKTINCFHLTPFLEKVAEKEENLTLGSTNLRSKTDEMFRSNQIACIWAMALEIKGRYQWKETSELLEWFKKHCVNSHRAILNKESWDCDSLRKSFYHHRKKYGGFTDILYRTFFSDEKSKLLNILYKHIHAN